jgi:hypothetical protein
MPITIDYAQPLRVIGQALEILKMESFELEPDGDDFVVRGKVTARGGGAGFESAESRNLRFNGEGEQNLEAPDAEPEATSAIVNQLDLCYTLKDVDRLEQKGQARRGEAPVVTQTPSLSHLLRTIGAYLEEKPARLVKIAKDGGSVTVVYETLSGIKFEEKLDGATLRDWEAQMFNKRTSHGFN